MGFLKNILKNNFGDPIEKLIRKLDSSSLEIQEKTIESLVKIGQPAVSRLIIETENENCIVARCACIALGKIGDSSAVDSLIAELKKDTYSKDERSTEVSPFAAEALAEIGNKKAVEPLIEALQNGSADTMKNAVWALKKLGDERAIAPLKDFCEKPNSSWVLKSAREALEELTFDQFKNQGLGNVVACIVKLKENSGYNDKDKRLAAIKALVKIGPPAVKPLMPYLQDSTSTTRWAAVQALGQIGNKMAVTALLDNLEDQDGYHDVKIQIVSVLERHGWQPDDSKTGALYWTAKYLYTDAGTREGVQSDRQIAANALKTIGWQPDKSEIGASCWIARSQWDKCLEIGIPAVKPLFITLQDTDETVQQAAANTLVQIGEPAVDPLISLLRGQYTWAFTDASSMVLRVNCAKVLGKIGDPRAINVLIDLFNQLETTVAHKRAAANALAMIGEPAVEPLIANLQNKFFNDHAPAAWALGQIGDQRAVEPLIILLSSDRPHHRKAAREALNAITGQNFGEDASR